MSGVPASSRGGLSDANAITGSAASGVPLAITGGTGQGPADFANLLSAFDSSSSHGFQIDSSGSGSIFSNTAAGADFRFQDGSGHYTAFQAGTVRFHAYNAAPADAALSAGDFVFWLDQTIGATKLMVKAKDSGGTVRTAAIALT